MSESGLEKTTEEFARIVSQVGIPRNTLYYILLGLISSARKLLTKAVRAGCPSADAHCVDFTDVQAGTELGLTHEKDGFTFESLDKTPLRVIGWGIPTGQSKLAVRHDGVRIKFPYATTWVAVRGAQYTSNPLVLRAFHEGEQVAEVVAPAEQNTLHLLRAGAEVMTSAIVSGGGNEGLLFDVCIPYEAEPGAAGEGE
ncbi:MAG: hypothetical protein ACP5JJ_14045 [Anaerolineae bacterium]